MIPSNFQVSHKPGVYIFKNKIGKILYVGKAIDLKSRVSSYFSCSHLSSGRVNNLVAQINSVETIEVFSEIEALILEANLIKIYRPPFNIKLTDDKDYLYIKITKEDFPKVITARKKELLDAKAYFGPFPSSNTVRSTLKKLRMIFPWCSQKKLFAVSCSPFASNSQKLIAKSYKPCFYYHLGLCPGVCAGKITRQEYNKIISRVIAFLNGKKDQVLKDLETEMNQYSKNMEFEKAQNIKKTIEGINYLTQENNIQIYLENPNFVGDQNKKALESLKKDLNLGKIPERIECYDISNISGKLAVGSLVVLNNGDFDKKWYRRFKISSSAGGDAAMIKEVLQRRIKHMEWPMPDLILVDGGRGQAKGANSELLMANSYIPVFGLAKRMEWLYKPNGEIIKLPRSSLSLKMLQKIRNEAHRFALNYHQILRNKAWYNN